MNKVYQTIVSKDNGNCMQATVASLFNKKLEEVPNFIELKEDWYLVMHDFFKKEGCEDLTPINRNRKDIEMLKKIAKFDGGINGYLYGVVNSQTFKDIDHAVVVDLDLNIVHDPNPNQLSLLLKPKDVWMIYVTKPMVIGKTGKIFSRKEWDDITKEERDLNTYKV